MNTPSRFLAAVFIPASNARFLSLMFLPGETDQPAVYLVVMNEPMIDDLIADLSEAGQGELSPPLYTFMRKLGEQKRRAQGRVDATYVVVMNEEMLDELLEDLQLADEGDLANSLNLLLERLLENQHRREEFHNSRGVAPEPRRRRFRRRKES